MQCKNCGHNLRTDYSYCPNCGAKVIRNRITFKNLWYDIIERYFNLDNTFLKTFFHLITKPQVVTVSYISGTRRKYLNPVSYIAIALFVSGISLFIMRKYAWDKIDFGAMPGAGNGEGIQKILEITMDYNSIIYLLYVPVIAFCGFIFFNKKDYNLSEHTVIGLYALATFSIMSSFIAIIWLLVDPETYFKSSFYVISAMMFYSLYVYLKLSGYGISGNILRSMGYIVLFLIGFLGIGMLMNIVMLAFGVIELQDFLPKKD